SMKMALAQNFLILLCSLTLFFPSPTIAQTSFRPKALVLPVLKDAATLQYVTHIKQRTPLVPVKLTVDLGGDMLWVDCERGYVSSTNRTARCGSAQCTLAQAKACDTGSNICGRGPVNTVTNFGTHDHVRIDVVSVQSTDGHNPGRAVRLPNFIFLCAPTFILPGLATGVTGMAALGRNKVALPSQFAAAFSFDRKFAICLSPSTSSNGFIIFGDGPYVLSPNIDVSKSLTYTPLVVNPVTGSGFLGEPSPEYFIGLKSITVNEKAVPINTTLLSIDSEGIGGTKISTVDRYTVMENSIYKALVQAFVNAMPNVPRTSPVAPFGACFNSKDLSFTRIGPSVPQIDLVLQNKKVKWSINGQNSMVQVGNVWCLAFVDGGVKPRASIAIGGRQLENNLLQFDLATSRLGFSNSLLFERTTCSNFNFTSTA
ncbi:Basic 7S globulin, partial [Melia azedarach]